MTNLRHGNSETTPLLIESTCNGSIGARKGSSVEINLPSYPSACRVSLPNISASVPCHSSHRDSVVSTSSCTDSSSQVTESPSPVKRRNWRKSCGFTFIIQALVILELVSLIFYITLFLYSFDRTSYPRTSSSLILASYVIVVMIYSLYSLQSEFPIILKILGSAIKLFISSLFFAFSLEHLMLLPAFFFYFFPTITGICFHFLVL